MTGRLQNKVAIITGASSGIGRQTAFAYAREGAIVVCSDLRKEPRGVRPEGSELTTTQELEKLGAKHMFIQCDHTISQQVENLVKKTVAEYGRLDIMVNNAGMGNKPVPVWDVDEEYWDLTNAVNLKGVFLGVKYAARQMKDQQPHESGDRGWIINLASVLGLNGTLLVSPYVASKHGVIGLTKSAAWDCAPHRIHVNAICPGYTATSMTNELFESEEHTARLNRMHPFGLGKPEDLAKAAVFLASEDAQWVTGVGLPVDGGYNAQ
ncbi:short-chain dehydrogenase/reductase-like protein [Polyplosphaeria fusca]|uniref:Short-chain dehydrogenase/reductase-like protein n=1 Tax=Polyplosphaeria fusca TaxID=682080 RepID=A0A9P4R4T0_9PLEO|nr:short-chain dehydrogenase/reductase-like protein [Polyplosphaeria fusca]